MKRKTNESLGLKSSDVVITTEESLNDFVRKVTKQVKHTAKSHT